jgi:hypothetical protein
MALGSTQPLAEMSTGLPTRDADNLTAICEPIVQKMWEPRRLTTLWAFTACYGDSFIFFFLPHLFIPSSPTFLSALFLFISFRFFQERNNYFVLSSIHSFIYLKRFANSLGSSFV